MRSLSLDGISIATVAGLIGMLYGIGFFIEQRKDSPRVMNVFWPMVAAQCLLLGSIVVIPFNLEYATAVLIVGILVAIFSILKIAYELTRREKKEKKGRKWEREFFTGAKDLRRSVQVYTPIEKPRIVSPGDVQAARVLVKEMEETIGTVKSEIGRRRSISEEDAGETRIQENKLDELERGLGRLYEEDRSLAYAILEELKKKYPMHKWQSKD